MKITKKTSPVIIDHGNLMADVLGLLLQGMILQNSIATVTDRSFTADSGLL